MPISSLNTHFNVIVSNMHNLLNHKKTGWWDMPTGVPALTADIFWPLIEQDKAFKLAGVFSSLYNYKMSLNT